MVSELWVTWTIKVDFPCHLGFGTHLLCIAKVSFVKGEAVKFNTKKIKFT